MKAILIFLLLTSPALAEEWAELNPAPQPTKPLVCHKDEIMIIGRGREKTLRYCLKLDLVRPADESQ